MMGKERGRLERLPWNDKHSFCAYLKRMCVHAAGARACVYVFVKKGEDARARENRREKGRNERAACA